MKNRSITPLPPADFTPEMGNYRTLQPFRYWCQKVLPLVYDDSLSYYELLCKVVDYLNKTMEDVETLHDDVTNLHTVYEQLQNYVNTYFSSLDVQEEINNKLDEMSSNGSLANLLNNNFLPIKAIKKVFNGTTVYYAIIDKKYEPILSLAGELGEAKTAQTFANEKLATILINGGVFNSANIPRGYTYINGEFLTNEQLTTEYDEKGADLLYFKNGKLDSVNSYQPIENIEKLNFTWCVQGWNTFVKNGEFIATNRDLKDYQPRSVICQDIQGNYLLMCCDGRLPVEKGLSLRECYDFIISIGFTVNFAYNLDGGGSTNLIYNTSKINKYIDQENRPIVTGIYFKKKNVLNNSIFDLGKANDDLFYRFARHDNHLYNNPLQIYNYKGGNSRVEFYNVNKETSSYKYVRELTISKDNGGLFIDGLNDENEYVNLLKLEKNIIPYISIYGTYLANFFGIAKPLPYNTINECYKHSISGVYTVSNIEENGLPENNSGIVLLLNSNILQFALYIEKTTWGIFIKYDKTSTWYNIPMLNKISDYKYTPPNGSLGTENNKLYHMVDGTWYDCNGVAK